MAIPPVSVVLTTYNRATVLAQTIDSILAQTFSDFELLVADNASTDSTQDVVRSYSRADPRVIYLRRGRNLGMPENLNRALLVCRGEFIANLHDGDIYAPELLGCWLDALKACPNAGFVFNAYEALAPSGEVLRTFREPLSLCNEGAVVLDIFFRRRHFDSPVWGTVMARRAAYDAVGLFDSRYGFVSDVDMWLRLAGQYHVAYVDRPLIGLPSKFILPHQMTVERSVWRGIRRAFLEARLRRYRDYRVRLAVELARHYAYSIFSDIYDLLLAGRRRVLQKTGRRNDLSKDMAS